MLQGEESTCRLTNPVDVRAMRATLYDMLCTGADSTWAERAILMMGAEGDLILVWDGYAFAYPACPKPTIRPRARPAPPPSPAMVERPRSRPRTFAQGG